ncbi:hypothetical protein [Streptomyces buecherae]|uniref:Uncharacterized protein n=1 Tax=Streptomyces buecherae TaxID=2763006 RepID=A0A7H8N3Y6_9ACTN|nr:hypothetical protein [Streptomyces buecherae]QKW49041.1 hypothetical protein HUT08_05215 [Streptomyces buecherae]
MACHREVVHHDENNQERPVTPTASSRSRRAGGRADRPAARTAAARRPVAAGSSGDVRAVEGPR